MLFLRVTCNELGIGIFLSVPFSPYTTNGEPHIPTGKCWAPQEQFYYSKSEAIHIESDCYYDLE